MKNKRVIILFAVVLSVLCSWANPPSAAAQTGYIFKPYWEDFYTYCFTNGTCDLTPHITNYCSSGSPGALVIFAYGTIRVNGSNTSITAPKWYLINNIDSLAATDTAIRNLFWNYYSVNGDGIGTTNHGATPPTFTYIHTGGILSNFGLVDDKNDITSGAFIGKDGSSLYEIFAYCAGSSQEPLNYINRFSFEPVPELSNYRSADGSDYVNLEHIPPTACANKDPFNRTIGTISNVDGMQTYSQFLQANIYNAYGDDKNQWSGGVVDNFAKNAATAQFLIYKNMGSITWADWDTVDEGTGGWSYPYRVGTKLGLLIKEVNAWCFNTDPFFGSKSCETVLIDGGMEQQPISSAWFPSADDNDGSYTFGRLDSGILSDGPIFGAARCERGYQMISPNVCNVLQPGSLNFYLCQIRYGVDHSASGIHQKFFWKGGSLYYRFSARSRPQYGDDRNVRVNVFVQSAASGAATYIMQEYPIPSEWTDYKGSIPFLSSGWYWANIYLGHNNAEFDGFTVDDFQFSTCILNGSCENPAELITPTPTPIGTLTPTSAAPAEQIIDNCGFEQGQMYWSFPKNTMVIFDTSNNYGHLNTNAAGPISQNFYWPGGLAYVRFNTDTAYNVYFINLTTGKQYPVLSSVKMVAGWPTWQNMVNLPAGPYSINLALLAGAGAGDYDNIAVATGGYVSCQSGGHTTATPKATSTQANTPTMFPTNTARPTTTTGPGTPTSTRVPSFTPYPTFTPKGTVYPTITPNPLHTQTSYPTYTPRPTYTAQPTYTMPPTSTTNPGESTSTPAPSYTPPPPTGTPPVPPPPPSYYADCNRPTGGIPNEAAWWLEYEKCQILSFFSMSPNAIATVVAAPTKVAGKEPMGLFKEVEDTANGMKGLIDSYDWNNTGLPGTGDTPSLDGFLSTPGPGNPLAGGKWDFTKHGPEISHECDTALTRLIGPGMAQGACFVFNALRQTGVLPWVQLMLDLTAIGILILYIWKKWVDAGAN